MKTFIEQAQLYSQYHQKPITFYTHLLGVPIIIFATMIFLGFIRIVIPGFLNASVASIMTFVLWLYYLRLNWRLSLIILPILALLLWLSSMVSYAGPSSFSLWFFIIAFVVGWIIQLLGHYFEGRKPALMDNFWQALIAPLYLTAEICFKLGFMNDLQEKLHGRLESTSIDLN